MKDASVLVNGTVWGTLAINTFCNLTCFLNATVWYSYCKIWILDGKGIYGWVNLLWKQSVSVITNHSSGQCWPKDNDLMSICMVTKNRMQLQVIDTYLWVPTYDLRTWTCAVINRGLIQLPIHRCLVLFWLNWLLQLCRFPEDLELHTDVFWHVITLCTGN